MNLRTQSILTPLRNANRFRRFVPSVLETPVAEPAQYLEVVAPQVDTFTRISVAGTPYECGFQYGQQAASQIRENVATYSRLFYYHADLDKATALQMAAKYIPEIEAYDAELIQEMQGVADGAGLDLLEVVMLNTRTELLSSVPLMECTSMATLAPASAHGKVWLAQNWDWYEVTIDNVLLYSVKQENRPAITMLVEAGQIGKMGINDAGLGLSLNWLETHHRRLGVPVVALCRSILKTGYPSQAIDAVYRAKRASASNFLIAHKNGFAIDLECTPDDIDFLEPENGIIVHSNHFVSTRLREHDHGVKDFAGNSLVRRQRGLAMLNSEAGNIDRMILQRVQRDNSCGNDSICMPINPEDDAFNQWGTLAGIIMDLSRMEMYIAKGRPNTTEYVRVIH